MKRKAQHTIEKWYQSNKETPLVITGPKGVGKTYLAFEVLENYEGNKVYLNFEVNPSVEQYFEYDMVEQIIIELTHAFSLNPSQETMVVLDECCASPHVLRALKLHNLSYPEFYFILITSDYIPRDIEASCCEQLQLMPLDFEEFLETTSNPWYVSVIREHYRTLRPIPEIVHRDIMDLFYDYLIIGGMPEAVNEYLAFHSLLNISEKHRMLISHLAVTLKEKLDESEFTKTVHILEVIDLQLAKKNKKFQYRLIHKGATKRQHANTVSSLVKQGVILPCEFIGETKGVKLYLFDTGLLLSHAKRTNPHSLNGLEEELYRGVLENYVAQSLYNNQVKLLSWESKAQAKVEFLIPRGEAYDVIEVYDTDNTRSKAIDAFSKSYSVHSVYKLSTKNFSRRKNVIYLPLYAAFCIE